MASQPKAPKPVDPNTIISAQQQANQINRITPFGSQMYSKGPDGSTTFTTDLSPAMKGLVDKSMSVAGTDLKPLTHPQGFDDLQSAMLSKVMGGQPQYQMPQKPQQMQLPSPQPSIQNGGQGFANILGNAGRP